MATAHERRSHSTIGEGVIAGAIGATGVALWFLIVDLVSTQIFYTPQRLGQAFGTAFGVTPMATNPTVAFLGYSVLHYLAFFAIGCLATAVVHASRRQPYVLVGGFLAFIVSEALIYGFIALLHETELLEHLTWLLIAIGNLIGAALIAWKLWRDHPGLGEGFDSALGESARARTQSR